MPDDLQLPKAYDSTQVEDAIYSAWMKSGFFTPENLPDLDDRKESYCISLPPPNVTGTLHIGHAVMLAIEDTMIRFARMSGKRALWVPGTDHAAIATESKVEKILIKKEGKTRHDLGREKFLERVNEFAKESHDTIVNQMKKMGVSIDWTREAYTIDEKRSFAVRTAFKKMYDDGLIYRGDKVVNWDPKGQTTVSDDEVEHETGKAILYTFKYSKDFPIPIATTRPETKVGDTAVAVHPKGKWKEFVGQEFNGIEFAGAKLNIKIIADHEVDPEFGTGALGVTPAHSIIDAEMAVRNDLPMVQVIDEQAKMTAEAGELVVGLSTIDARVKIVEWLKENDLMVGEEEVEQSVSVAQRSGGVIEPLPKLQWFINVSKEFEFHQSERNPIAGLKDGQQVTLKQLMKHVVENGQIEILPDRFKKVYFHWIDNLRDWCISRQIWFGHQVPAFVCFKCNEDLFNGLAGVFIDKDGDRKGTVNYIDENGNYFADFEHTKRVVGEGRVSFSDKFKFFVSEDENPKCRDCGCESVIQDPDSLDTWFSSGLWTFSILGWPDQESEDLHMYHPNAVMETGYDILPFWVARMILMSTCLLGEIPFKTVYFHGLVRDEQGRKMSKSLDNAVDPLDAIKEYGADATRLSMMIGQTPGNDTKLSDDKIASYRNFTNKLWNISRFVFMSVDQVRSIDQLPEPKTLADQWILARYADVVARATAHYEKYEYSLLGELLRDFTWGEFADWYLEIAKVQKKNGESQTDEILLYVLEGLLKLWHPLMPFVTEELYKQFDQGMIIVAKWPAPFSHPEAPEGSSNSVVQFEQLRDIVTVLRNVRAEYKIAYSNPINVTIVGASGLEEYEDVIQAMVKTGSVIWTDRAEKPEGALALMTGSIQLYVPVGDLIDFDKERTRIKAELEEVESYIKRLSLKLKDKEFVNNAPAEVVEAEQSRIKEAQGKQEALKREFDNLT